MEAISSVFPLLRFDKVEADDLAAYICKKLNTLNIQDIWLISSDKDYDLLVNENISRFSYVTRKETTLSNWNEHYDYDPEDHISIKCLMGDTGDNIKGIEGIGPKRAHELVNTYGTALDLYANLPITSKYKYIKALNDSGDTIPLNYQLMDLLSFCEDAIGEANIIEIEKVLDNYVRSI